jgi:hypothetical protein
VRGTRRGAWIDGLGGLIGRRKADETEALGRALLVAHDLAARHGAKGLELGAELLVVDLVLQVFDVQVDALVLAELLHLGLLVGPAQLLLALRLLLRTCDKELLAIVLSVVKGMMALSAASPVS